MAEISKIKLPSGNEYDIKDAVARQMISGGVSFIITWDGTSAPTVENIPAGVTVTYSGTTYTGTLDADDAEAGAFYLVKSSTQPSSETLDKYDEYVPTGTAGNKAWEKIGDTQINLTDVVTAVTLSKNTDTVIGSDATFANTQPTISLSAEGSSAAGRAEFVQQVDKSKKISGTATGGVTSWNNKDSVTVLTNNTDVSVTKGNA